MEKNDNESNIIRPHKLVYVSVDVLMITMFIA